MPESSARTARSDAERSDQVAVVVGGLATSHSPQVSMPGVQWPPYGEQEVASGRLDKIPYRSARTDDLSLELRLEVVEQRAARCQRAIEVLTAELADQKPDVLVIVGDDQKELYLDDGIPTFALYTGEELWDLPPGPEAYPSGMKDAYYAYHAASPEAYPASPSLAAHVATSLCCAGFDITVSKEQHQGRGLGHAFTFPRLRLLPSAPMPVLAVLVNTYFPPNQPTPDRCIEFGRSLRDAIDSWPDDARVTLIASGGLSHPIVDEALDCSVLSALEHADLASLAALPTTELHEGNSEIRNWIVVGAALSEMRFEIADYIPGYRSLVGSGCGMGFGRWTSTSTPPSHSDHDQKGSAND